MADAVPLRRDGASSRSRSFLAARRLTISPITPSCSSKTAYTTGGKPMGSTIDLKCRRRLHAFRLHRRTGECEQGDRGDPGDFRRQPSHARYGRPLRRAGLRGVRAGAVRPRREGCRAGYTADDIAKGRDYRMKLDDAKVMADVEAAAKPPRRQETRASSATASAARSPGGALPAATASPRRPAGTAAALPAPRTRRRTARCRCISARRTLRSR